jgi:replicative DNA helicase
LKIKIKGADEMTAIERLKKEVDLKNYIEGVTNQKAYSVGSDTYRFARCPICGGGDHFTINTAENYFNTWNNCGAGSIIDFYMAYTGNDQKTAIEELLNEFNLNDSDFSFNCDDERKNRVKPDDKQTAKPEKVVDLTPYVQDYFTTHDIDYSYFQNRLLKEFDYPDMLNAYDKLIFDNKFLVAKPSEVFPVEYLPKINNIDAYECIIPVWKDNKVVNAILRRNDSKSKENQKTMNLKGLNVEFFNSGHLKKEKLIFVTEGVFDCLSLEMLCYKSICLNSTNMANKFIDTVKANIDKCQNTKFVLALDNDDKGKKAKDKIYTAFKELDLKVSILSFGKDGQDINDFYLEDVEGLKETIEDHFRPPTVSKYMKTFLSNVAANKKIKPASTGFKGLDEKLNGGLYPGLYVLGAISSLGKTAIGLQIADNIAASGQHVMFFSLEMPQDELISRSVSRIMYELEPLLCHDCGTVKVLNGKVGDCESEFYQAVEQYTNTTAKHLQIIQGDYDMDINTIIEHVETFIFSTGIKPIVFVDYLQLVKSSLERVTEKQAMDDIVLKLKLLSGRFKIPVFVVSSFNRENYNTIVSFSSFKESGGIEYTADVVIGLQLTAMNHDESGSINTDKTKKAELNAKLNLAKDANPREITLFVLKNRNGKPYGFQNFKFYATNNCFIECEYKPKRPAKIVF